MSACANLIYCPFDEKPPRECGDDGDLCESCMAVHAAYWRGSYDAAPLSERDPEHYHREMIAAGRGHQVRDYAHMADLLNDRDT